MVGHGIKPTSSTLADAVLSRLSVAVLEVGELLDEAFENYRDFDQWVEDNLPLQVHTAERIRAMYHVHQLPGDRDLPEPWKALWSLG